MAFDFIRDNCWFFDDELTFLRNLLAEQRQYKQPTDYALLDAPVNLSRHRRDTVMCIIKMCAKLRYYSGVSFCAIYLFDAVLLHCTRIAAVPTKTKMNIMAVACVHLAAKVQLTRIFLLRDLARISVVTGETETSMVEKVKQYEMFILKTVRYVLKFVHPQDFSDYVLHTFELRRSVFNDLRRKVHVHVDACMSHSRFMTIDCSTIAAYSVWRVVATSGSNETPTVTEVEHLLMELEFIPNMSALTALSVFDGQIDETITKTKKWYQMDTMGLGDLS